VLAELRGALGSARATLAGFLELLSLEARRAGVALAWMVAAALVAAFCIAAGWLGLMAALAMWIASLGADPFVAVVAVASINLVCGVALLWLGIHLSRALLFSATRRRLAGQPSSVPPAP
jgi:hypothetical protein